MIQAVPQRSVLLLFFQAPFTQLALETIVLLQPLSQVEMDSTDF